MIEATACLAAAILLGFGGRRLALARRAGADPAHRYLCGFALLMGASLIILDPANLTELGKAVPEVAAVLAGDALKTAAVSALVLFAISLSPEGEAEAEATSGTGSGSRRRRATSRALAVALAVQLASAALLLLAHPGARGGSLLTGGTAGRLLLSAYDTVFTGYALWCLLVLGRVLVSHLRGAGPGLLRVGLRLSVAAVAAGALWTAWSLDDIAGILTRGTQDGGEDVLSNLLGVVSGTLVVAAATVTLWGARLVAPCRWLRAYRRYRALEPLWSALHAELPEIALTVPGPGRRIPLWQAEFALYRRIIEIRDAQLALRPYVEPAGAARPCGGGGPSPAEPVSEESARGEPASAGPMSADSVSADPPPAEPASGGSASGARTRSTAQAAEEAAALAAALANYRQGRRRTGEPDAVLALALRPMPGTVEAEASWLVQVARAFPQSGARLSPGA